MSAEGSFTPKGSPGPPAEDNSAQNVAQGSTAEYCSRWPGESHAMSTHVRGGTRVSVRRCDWCGWIDFADLDEQVTEQVKEALGRAAAVGSGDDPPITGEPFEPWARRQIEKLAYVVGVLRDDIDRAGLADPDADIEWMVTLTHGQSVPTRCEHTGRDILEHEDTHDGAVLEYRHIPPWRAVAHRADGEVVGGPLSDERE